MSNIGGDRAQTGDITTGHTAGRDIEIGINPEMLLKLLETQIETESKMRILLISAIEKQQAQISREIRELRIVLIMVAVAFLVLIVVIL